MARDTGYCGLILNETTNAEVGLVDADGAGTGTGYAAFRMANRNGRLGGDYPTNIHVGEVIARTGLDRRDKDDTVSDYKDVVSGCLGYVAFVVKHNRFRHVVVQRLDLGQYVVEVVEALDLGRDGQGVIAHGRGADYFQETRV